MKHEIEMSESKGTPTEKPKPEILESSVEPTPRPPETSPVSTEENNKGKLTRRAVVGGIGGLVLGGIGSLWSRQSEAQTQPVYQVQTPLPNGKRIIIPLSGDRFNPAEATPTPGPSPTRTSTPEATPVVRLSTVETIAKANISDRRGALGPDGVQRFTEFMETPEATDRISINFSEIPNFVTQDGSEANPKFTRAGVVMLRSRAYEPTDLTTSFRPIREIVDGTNTLIGWVGIGKTSDGLYLFLAPPDPAAGDFVTSRGFLYDKPEAMSRLLSSIPYRFNHMVITNGFYSEPPSGYTTPMLTKFEERYNTGYENWFRLSRQ